MLAIIKVLSGICSGLWSAFVIMTLWRWYLTPWLGLSIAYKQAVGLDLLVTLITYRYIPIPEGLVTRGSDNEPLERPFTHSTLIIMGAWAMPTLIFALGWFLKAVLP